MLASISSMESVSTGVERTRLTASGGPFTSDALLAGHSRPTLSDEVVSTLWEFLTTFRDGKLRQFRPHEFTGGESAIAEGSTFVIDKRSVRINGQERIVAVKRLKRHLPGNFGNSEGSLTLPQMRSIIQDVAAMARESLSTHPSIIQMFGYGWTETLGNISIFHVVEYSAFGSLVNVLREQSFSWEAKLDACLMVATGLNALHATNLVHGDVKVENVLAFEPHHDRAFPYLLKISDFGSSIEDVEGKYAGTTVINAPEARSGAVNVRRPGDTLDKFFRCDVYSFGLLVWETLLDGKRFWTAVGATSGTNWLNDTAPEDVMRKAVAFVGALNLPDHILAKTYLATFQATLAAQPSERKQMKYVTMILQARLFS